MPYQSSQKSSHNTSGASKKSDESKISLKVQEKEIAVSPADAEEIEILASSE